LPRLHKESPIHRSKPAANYRNEQGEGRQIIFEVFNIMKRQTFRQSFGENFRLDWSEVFGFLAALSIPALIWFLDLLFN